MPFSGTQHVDFGKDLIIRAMLQLYGLGRTGCVAQPASLTHRIQNFRLL
jgi:hypothetical protein